MLKEFFDHFYAQADNGLRQCWKFHEYETKFGSRKEVQFVGSAVILMELPDESFEFLVIRTKETRIYKHASYLLSMFSEFVLSERAKHSLPEQFQVKLHGSGFQPFVGVNNVQVDPINASGTIAQQSVLGGWKEHEVTQIVGVQISKKVQ